MRRLTILPQAELDVSDAAAWLAEELPRVIRRAFEGNQVRAAVHVHRFPSVSFSQNCFGMPACFNTALAVWRDRILWSTGKRRSVIGLYQIS